MLGFRGCGCDDSLAKLAWRFDEAGAGLDSAAWSLDSDVTEIRSLDSVDVDAIKPAWRFDAVQIRSLDTKLGLCGRGCDKVGVEGRCCRYSKLGFLAGGCYDAGVEGVPGTGCRVLAAKLPIVLLGAGRLSRSCGAPMFNCDIVS